jgi:hypothetical protein
VVAAAVSEGMTAHVRMMRSLTLFVLLASPTAAFAQDSTKAGIAMTSSGGLSLIWDVSERIAIRPEIGINRARIANSVLDAESKSFNLSPGIAALFYTGPRGAFRTYFSPRYVYNRSHSESNSPVSSTESTVGTHTFSGSLGAQYKMHERFAAFGELGASFSHTKVSSTTNNSWSTRSVAGVIWYF